LNAITDLAVKGFAHKDLKLENFLFNSEGMLKMCDFGFSTNLKNNQNDGLGTDLYRAPEILRVEIGGVVDYSKSDVYSLGVILFEMISGKKPYSH